MRFVFQVLLLALPLCHAAPAADLAIGKRYLHLPVARGGELRNVRIRSGNETLHYFRIALPKDKSDPLYWTSIDAGALKGKTLAVVALPPGPEIDMASLCEQSDAVRQPSNLYREAYRPQYHFTAATGWINDPNGLVYYDGEYQLFYQHDPYGSGGANKSWGRAVSRDLVHWTDFGDVLLPDRLGAIYSGSAVIDHRNTSGFQRGSPPPMVVFYTSAGDHAPERLPFTQSLAYSSDRGRTWTKFAGNPVIGHIEGTNRDPKVFWHDPSRRWVMALYLNRGKFALLGSSNLRQWSKLSDVEFPDGFECPEFFEMPVDGDAANTRWVFWEAGGRHRIGRFDGRNFAAETAVLPSEWGGNSYAGQTWNDAPGGRRLFISWMAASGKRAPEPIYPGMPFNQQMSFPREFSLRTTPDGPRIFAQPAREIAKLYARQHRWANVKLGASGNPLARLSGELFDIEADVELREARTLKLDLRGTPIVFDAAAGRLTCLGKSAEFRPANGRLDLRVLADRTSIEIFAAGGRCVLSFCFKPDPANRKLSLTADGGAALVRTLRVRELTPALPAFTRPAWR
ncbi:MAG: glycoside hydrolase family 32 protein [Acidobacteria bacterium]|nr:glycoside hydrolase family 32 protein [Acidobacteriota bacterium]